MRSFVSDRDISDLLSKYGLTIRKELHRDTYQIRYIVTDGTFEYSFLINLGNVVYSAEMYQTLIIRGIERAIMEYKKRKGESDETRGSRTKMERMEKIESQQSSVSDSGSSRDR